MRRSYSQIVADTNGRSLEQNMALRNQRIRAGKGHRCGVLDQVIAKQSGTNYTRSTRRTNTSYRDKGQFLPKGSMDDKPSDDYY